MARKEPLLSALKGERGPPGSGTGLTGSRRGRAGAPQPLASRKFIPVSARCSSGNRGVSDAAAGPRRAVPGAPPPLSRLSTHGRRRCVSPRRSGAAAAGGRGSLHGHLAAPRVAVPAAGEHPAQGAPTTRMGLPQTGLLALAGAAPRGDQRPAEPRVQQHPERRALRADAHGAGPGAALRALGAAGEGAGGGRGAAGTDPTAPGVL